MKVYVASTSHVKMRAAAQVFGESRVESLTDTCSGVPEQPVGVMQTKRGAINRIDGNPDHYDKIFRLGIESGLVVRRRDLLMEISYVVLRTNLGMFVHRSSFLVADKISKPWVVAGHPQCDTMATLAKERGIIKDDKDWYVENQLMMNATSTCSRVDVIARCIQSVLNQYLAKMQQLAYVRATTSEFRGVQFLDIGAAMHNHGPAMIRNLGILMEGLYFTHVVGVQSRGFIGLLELTRLYPGVRVLMARSRGKLPGEDEAFYITDEYDVEYGPKRDPLYMQRKFLPEGSRVVVYDDVMATGGTMSSIVKAIRDAGSEVVACVAPFAVTAPESKYLGVPLAADTRYLHTVDDVVSEPPPEGDVELPESDHIFIAGDKYATYLRGHGHPVMPMRKDRFAYSCHNWFPCNFSGVSILRDKLVTVVVDSTDPDDMLTMLQMIKILPRYDVKDFRVVFPFLEHSTQERIEERMVENVYWRSLAQADTILSLFSPHYSKHPVYVFDLHAENTVFSGYDVRNISMMHTMLECFFASRPNARPTFPDAGAAKRFGPIVENLGIATPLLTMGKKRDGDKRVITTLDDIVLPEQSQSQATLEFVIMDDMVRSGGTLRNVAEHIREACNNREVKIYVVATHMPLSASSALMQFEEVWKSDTVLGPFAPPADRTIVLKSWVDMLPMW